MGSLPSISTFVFIALFLAIQCRVAYVDRRDKQMVPWEELEPVLFREASPSDEELPRRRVRPAWACCRYCLLQLKEWCCWCTGICFGVENILKLITGSDPERSGSQREPVHQVPPRLSVRSGSGQPGDSAHQREVRSRGQRSEASLAHPGSPEPLLPSDAVSGSECQSIRDGSARPQCSMGSSPSRGQCCGVYPSARVVQPHLPARSCIPPMDRTIAVQHIVALYRASCPRLLEAMHCRRYQCALLHKHHTKSR